MPVRAAVAPWSAAVALAALGVVTTVAAVGCGDASNRVGGGLFRQYEYEEEVYLALDGTATIYVNTSLAALNALRGSSFATAPNAPLDRDGVRAFFSTPVTRISGQVNASRRSNRRFVHVKLEVDDITRLNEARPFAWSTYDFKRDGDLYFYRQTVGIAVGRDVGEVGWTGSEIVAFRLHLPSTIRYHNSGRETRGNILTWEQPLTDRLRGAPLMLDARMDPQSILYRTLWLFAWTFVAVAITFVLVIWWVRRQAPAEKRAA
jgi:hypothetical protein